MMSSSPLALHSAQRWVMVCAFVLASLFVIDAWIPSVSAENRYTPLQVVDPGGGVEPTQCSNSTYAIPHVIECIKISIINATYATTLAVEQALYAPMIAFLTLVVVFFGVQLLTQERQMQQKAFILLLKVAFVFWITNGFGGLIGVVFNVMDELQNIVASALYQGSFLSAVVPGSGTTIGCNDISSFFTEGDLWIFAHMSCILGQLLGYGPNVVLSGSLFGLLGAFVGGGAIGVTIFFEGIIALVTLILLVLRACFFYVTAYLMVGLLIMISPIFIPLIFLKQTFNYFNKWLSQLQAAIINPMIITAYLVLALLMVDAVMFSRDDSLARVLNSETMEGCLKQKTLEGAQVMRNPATAGTVLGISPELFLEQANNKDLTNPSQSGLTSVVQSLIGDVSVGIIDCPDDPTTPENEHYVQLQAVLGAVLRLLLIVWLLGRVMATVTTLATQLTGSGYRLNTAVQESFGTDIQRRTQDTITNAKRQLASNAQSAPGPAGVSALIGAATGNRSRP